MRQFVQANLTISLETNIISYSSYFEFRKNIISDLEEDSPQLQSSGDIWTPQSQPFSEPFSEASDGITATISVI